MGFPGSPQRMQRLVDDYYPCLYRYAYRLTGCTADAEDLTQEAFCTAQAKLGQLRDAERVKAWLFTVLRNAYLHRIRSDKPQRFVPPEVLNDVADRPPRDLPSVDPARLQAALNELAEVFRTPIILYYFEDFSYRAIAEQMNLPLGTVMSRLARGKPHLRARLQGPAPDALADAQRGANDGL